MNIEDGQFYAGEHLGVHTIFIGKNGQLIDEHGIAVSQSEAAISAQVPRSNLYAMVVLALEKAAG